MDPDARMHRPTALLRAGLLALAVALGGCAHRAPGPPPPTPPPGQRPPPIARPLPGYEARIDSLDVVDTGALAGKRIAIDPGHGGFFRGSLGVNGLAEADVNLGVALELQHLLEAHGARVFMTRSTDRDFLSRADSALRADLTERVRLANAFHPDFFLSIHHNADPGGAHDKNEIQTYYKLGDEGASIDAAASLHRFLKRNVGIERQRIVPGNYFVLRNSDAPAVLTEASYLTNPDVEARLQRTDKRRLEAEALFLGLAHYFARSAPIVTWFTATGAGPRPDTSFVEIDGPTLAAEIAGSFDRVDLELDGQVQAPERSGSRLTWHPPAPLAVGRHEARLQVALSGIGVARERTLGFWIARRPAALQARWYPPVASRWMAVRIAVVDRAGLPCRDSLRLRLKALQPGISPAETLVTVRDGVGWAYPRLARRRPTVAGPWLKITLAGATPLATSLPAPRPARPASHSWTGWAVRMPEATPLRGAPGTREPDRAVSWITRDGFLTLEGDSAARPRIPLLAGFRTWGADTTLPPRWTAVAGGALHGRRILLDPDGGGEESGGMGPSGTRAAFYNMDVARALASYLGAAGAEVRLARVGDDATSDVERVRIGESFQAERYLRIGHRAEPPRLGYYPSSAAGRRWAQHIAAWLGRLGLGLPAVAEDAQYPLQQSSSTAIYCGARRIDDAAEEEAMNAPGAARAEAYALYLGVLEEWTSDAHFELDSLEVRDSDGSPAAGAVVTLSGAFVLQADPRGVVRFARTEPGPIEVVVEHPRVSARRLLLDSERGIILTGPARR
jgi:N-acetylmuramoyl-L-alanine amidase